VMLTADGVPILMHDETLERTTRCNGLVAERNFAEIRACDTQVPTLAEAMDACRRHGFWTNIEIKPATGHEEATGTTVGEWLAAHWDGNGVVSSFSEKSALAARRQLPGATFALLCEALPADWRARAECMQAAAIHLAAECADAAAVAQLGVARMPWGCWTVNDRRSADRLFAQGCVAVFTDRPDLWSSEEMQPT
jgi:glycerophosphoryl diester phosphodiesterase